MANNIIKQSHDSDNRIKLLNVESLLWLSLALALAGSLKHLAAIFASIDSNVFMGWLQAIAIDAGLFALAYSIRVRKVAKRSVKPLWFGVSVFTGISVYGNLSYGLVSTTGNLPGWILVSKPYVLAASLPVLVLFLSELLSDNRQYANEVAEKESKKVATQRIDMPANNKLADVNAEKVITKEENLKRVASILTANSSVKNSQLATMLNVSRATIRNYRQELTANGKVLEDGKK